MSRFKDAEPILAAAEHWKRRCLLGAQSLFTEWSLWTREGFDKLNELYVKRAKDGLSATSFLSQLEDKLKPGPPDASCLWAEMTWVYHLIQSSMKAVTKRDRIREIWSWSGRDFPADHDLLNDAVLGTGVANLGIPYNVLAWKEFRYFATVMLRWFSLKIDERESLLDHPWDCASWLDAGESVENRMFRQVMLFLLFPDEFEPITESHKRKIVAALGNGNRLEPADAVAIDREVLAIRHRLEREYPGEIDFYRSPIEELWRGTEEPSPGSYSPTQARQDLFLDPDHFDRLLTSIKSGKNLILQGPPGTGKTFIARRIAWCLIGRKDDGPTEMVQFHQSYAYEDFVEGFKPTKEGGFDLKLGVFRRFCERAQANPDTPHVFIIDEINRGNLSRIFGELLMLIEHDKRSEDYAVALTYSDEPFHVPENIFILGMMNTADRSLALVDYALRRRFAFETLEPAFGHRAFAEHLTEKGADPELVRRISERMAKLNKKIRDDQELGSGFQIGHSYFVPGDGDKPSDDWYKHVVDTRLAPLLREYWFDAPEDVETEVAQLLGDG